MDSRWRRRQQHLPPSSTSKRATKCTHYGSTIGPPPSPYGFSDTPAPYSTLKASSGGDCSMGRREHAALNYHITEARQCAEFHHNDDKITAAGRLFCSPSVMLGGHGSLSSAAHGGGAMGRSLREMASAHTESMALREGVHGLSRILALSVGNTQEK